VLDALARATLAALLVDEARDDLVPKQIAS
jgi:hypothetical protein